MPEVRDTDDRRIINALQGAFPLCDEPYRVVADALDLDESDLMARLQRLLESRVLTRFGPMVQVERMGGSFVLAAMKVPEAEFDRVAAIIGGLPEVAHNYRREHEFNMWFVLATETPDGITAAIDRLQEATGYAIFDFPKEREYFVELKLMA